VDLEHGRLHKTMLPQVSTAPAAPISARQARAGKTAVSAAPPPNAATWWHAPPVDALLTGLLPQHQPFRDDSRHQINLCLRPSDDDPDRIELTEVLDAKTGRLRYLPIQGRHEGWPDSAVHGPGITPWADLSYAEALQDLAQAMNLSLPRCAERFGTLSLPDSEQGWRSHPVLGFVQRR
jgi:CRISPR-associated endonuclease/helicase Cas3